MRLENIILALRSIECILNFGMFESYQFTYDINAHFEQSGGHQVVQDLMAYDNSEISVKATSIMQDYIEKEDDLVPNIIENHQTKGGHLFDDTKLFNIW